MQNEWSNVKRWLEAGKQIGKSISYNKEGKLYWIDVGIQKQNGIYKLYINEIEEAHMAQHEDFLIERVINVETFERLESLVAENSPLKLDDLTPCKGQKVFNPEFF